MDDDNCDDYYDNNDVNDGDVNDGDDSKEATSV